MTDAFPSYPAIRETTIAVSRWTTPSGGSQLADTPVLERFGSDSIYGVRRRVQSPDTDQLKASKPASATTGEVSFGPFRLLPAQFLLLEGDKPVPLGSRALHILIVLFERSGELVIQTRVDGSGLAKPVC
jgi:hypothetical protein